MTDLDSTTFAVVRGRLQTQAAALGTAVQALDIERRRLFGAGGSELIATHRVRTENACIPRDLVAIPTPDGTRFILGCEVILGLRSRITPADVFTELRETEEGLVVVAPTLLTDPGFAKDFAEIFQYHKEARLLHLRRTAEQLLIVFQAGLRLTDVKVLRFSLVPEGLRYRDNRGERDYVFPPACDFTWTRSTREQHVLGTHPHINIADTVFVECVGGDLTVKIENNTATGQGIYAEPVENPTQGLDDAEVAYALLESCILLRIRPYQERDVRYLAFNRRTQEVVRLDELGLACQQLPDGHGLIFPGGAYLADGRLKRWPVDAAGMEFKRLVRSPNGEDVCYVYYRRDLGTYLLLIYNLISRELTPPLSCHSWCGLADGRVILLRVESEAARIHTLQVWRTPFCSDEHHAAQLPTEDGFLARLGNRELVRAVSDLLQLQRLAGSPTPTRSAYDDLLRHLGRCRDAYPWLAQVGDLATQLAAVHATGSQVVDEFAKVSELTVVAERRVAAQAAAIDGLLGEAARSDRSRLDGFVQPLVRLQAQRGQVAALREVRFADAARIDALDQRLAQAITALGTATVDFLLGESALAVTTAEITEIEAAGATAATVAVAAPLLARLADLAQGLDTLVELVGSLDIPDQTRRTAILERIALVYAGVGRAKAVAQNRRTELGQAEGRGAFAVQVQLLAQATANSLSLASDPDRCDDLVAKLLIQVEDLEGRFGEFPEFIAELGAKRAEIADAFAGQKQRLLDARARQADGLTQALERILATVTRRCAAAASRDELHAYLASDPLVQKARSLIAQTAALGATVAASDAEGRLAAARDAGLRRLRDRAELFDASGAIKLGRHRFAVNQTALALTMLPRRDAEGVPHLVFHLAGTEYERLVADPALAGTEALWEQPSEAETVAIYRAEFLAWSVLPQVPPLAVDDVRAELVREFIIAHPEHGYERGIHDADAGRILAALITLRDAGGLLRFGSEERAAAQVAWQAAPDPALARRCRSLATLRARLGEVPEIAALRATCGDYLFEELARNASPVFVRAHEAVELVAGVSAWARDQGIELPVAEPGLVTAWVRAWAERHRPDLLPALAEAVAELCCPDLARETVTARTVIEVDGLLGTHPRIRSGRMELRLAEFTTRLTAHVASGVPAHRTFVALRRRLLATEEERLRLAEFRPQVLASFVRNRLIDEVFLPLIGDNLAKQIGTLGADRRTDLQGMLLLISPPGYGKTTLMEYLAAVLGLVFVKINGPTLGHQVTSLDPAEAPNAAARREVERINLAFAMGSNVLLYLDDIQHTDPELLQRFISLCDGQRRIDGVWEGQSRTFDLRGKRFVVCMAGNPYTESGARFRIPDMLANRADTCNLGDLVGRAEEPFALSYIENALVANPVLKPLASRAPGDLFRLLRLVEGDEAARSELEHPFTATEIAELVAVLSHLRQAQRVVLTVNQAYIASAAQADADRSEPPFKLQGSYRNLGKLAAKIVPAMTAAEVEDVIRDHYRQEAQTLTQGAEANLLKLNSLLGWLREPVEIARWDEIRRGFARRTELAGSDDPVQQGVLQLAKLVDGLDRLRLAGERPAVAPKLEVINTLPAYYAKLYEQHLHVLETSLVPVLDLLGRFTGTQERTRAELAQVAGEMRQVLAKQRNAGRIDLDPPTDGGTTGGGAPIH